MRPAKRPGSRPPAVALLGILALFTVVTALPGKSRAGVTGYLEYDYGIEKRKSVQADGESIRTDLGRFQQWYNITLDQTLYPNLRLTAAGYFRRFDSFIEQGGVESDFTTTTYLPYIYLSLKTPLYKADVTYSRREEKAEGPGGFSFTTVRDFFAGTVYWRPDRFPDLRLQYFWDHTYDEDRRITDTVNNGFQVTSTYYPVPPLWLYYQGTYRDTELKLTGTNVQEMGQNGRVSYNNNWLRQRVTLGLGYNIRYQRTDVETSGAGEVGLPVIPFFGLSALSDTPQFVRLDQNSALIDGDSSSGTGIDLGLPGPGESTALRNMGLDFLVPTEVNTLYVSVAQDLTAQVAGAFTWRIYTSGDNQNWQTGPTVAPAFYSPTLKRFEIRFPNVTARYVKVVTAPLAPTVSGALSFPDILVTELQSEIRRPASQVSGTTTSTNQTGNALFRAVLLEPYALTYDLAYFFKMVDPGISRYTVSNALSFYRQFNPVFSGTGRVSYDYEGEENKRGESFNYALSVTAIPVRALLHTLTLSGREESSSGIGSSEISILLYNIARLYEGIDANLSGGISLKEVEAGGKNRTYMANAGASFVPNRKVTFNLLYNGTTSVISGGTLQGENTTFTRGGEANLTYTPVPTLFFYGSYRIEASTDFPNRNIWNYSLSWSPFPDGTLKFAFYYNETVRTDDTSERNINPSVQWYFRPGSYLQLSYQNYRSEAPAQTTTSDQYAGTLRFSF